MSNHETMASLAGKVMITDKTNETNENKPILSSVA